MSPFLWIWSCDTKLRVDSKGLSIVCCWPGCCWMSLTSSMSFRGTLSMIELSRSKEQITDLLRCFGSSDLLNQWIRRMGALIICTKCGGLIKCLPTTSSSFASSGTHPYNVDVVQEFPSKLIAPDRLIISNCLICNVAVTRQLVPRIGGTGKSFRPLPSLATIKPTQRPLETIQNGNLQGTCAMGQKAARHGPAHGLRLPLPTHHRRRRSRSTPP